MIFHAQILKLHQNPIKIGGDITYSIRACVCGAYQITNVPTPPLMIFLARVMSYIRGILISREPNVRNECSFQIRNQREKSSLSIGHTLCQGHVFFEISKERF